jgi:hypothetical protein
MVCLQYFNHKEHVWNDKNIKVGKCLNEWSWHVCSTLIIKNKHGMDMVWWEWQVEYNYGINVMHNEYGIKMTIWGELGKGLRPRGTGIQCYWKAYLIFDTTLGFTWIKGK